MSILDTFIGILAPHNCLGCGREGNLLCAICSNTLKAPPEYCYRCQIKMNKSLTCPPCRQVSPLQRVYVATVYGDAAKQLIWRLKLAGAQSAARIMAQPMASLLQEVAKVTIVPVPTATSRTRQRGYDQAKLLARELSRQTRLPYADCLIRTGQTHQHGSRRQERLAHLTSAFHVKRSRVVRNSSILLVDDVTTTGATLEAAGMALREAGVARLEAIVFARPEKQ